MRHYKKLPAKYAKLCSLGLNDAAHYFETNVDGDHCIVYLTRIQGDCDKVWRFSFLEWHTMDLEKAALSTAQELTEGKEPYIVCAPVA